MPPARLVASAVMLGLAAALGACSPQATAPSAPATAAPVAFSATVAPVVAALTARGFACDPAPDPSAPARTFGTAMDKVMTRICRKPANDSGQGTFVYLYMLRADMSTVVGIDLLSDQAGPAGVSSPEVSGVIGLVFSAQDAAAVEEALAASTAAASRPDSAAPTYGPVASVGAWMTVGSVSVESVPQPMAPVNLSIWGPEVVAAAAGLSPSPVASN